MKLANKALRLVSHGMLFAVTPFVIFFIVISCQRTIDHVAISDEFNSTAAKEWYYGTFKKTTEWASSPEHGKKLPDWKNGVYGKIGTMEIVEFPLVKAKTSFPISSVGSLTTADRKRVAEASLTRIVFIKNANQKIVVREIDYIPDWDYLQKRNFDISNDVMGKANNGFSGRLIVKKWNSTMLTSWIVKNGEFKKKIRPVVASSPAGRTLQCGTLVFWFDRDCGLAFVGDALQFVCGEWEYTGNSDFIPYPCEETSPCEGLTPEQCACETYQTCYDDGGDEDAENCSAKELEWSSGVTSASDLESVTTVTASSDTRTKNYVWIYAKGAFNTTLKWKSHESGVHIKESNEWKWQSLTHKSISKEGTVIGGSLECSVNSATPYIGQYFSGMTIDYTFTWSFVCKGSPISSSANRITNSPVFNVNN